jgi:hypothetical protein
MIIQSIFLAILPYFFLHISNSCSPYNAKGVDCFVSFQAHDGFYTESGEYKYDTINQSACALNEPDYNITLPIDCSNFSWYEQYGRNSAEEVPVVCFKISYSDPFIALAILTSILKTILPFLFQAVLFVYLNVLGKCVRFLLNRCRCTRSLPWVHYVIMFAMIVLQPSIAFAFILGVSICVMLISDHIFDYLTIFGEQTSTTLLLCVFIIVSLTYPSWLGLAYFKVEGNELTLYETFRAQLKVKGKNQSRANKQECKMSYKSHYESINLQQV